MKFIDKNGNKHNTFVSMIRANIFSNNKQHSNEILFQDTSIDEDQPSSIADGHVDNSMKIEINYDSGTIILKDRYDSKLISADIDESLLNQIKNNDNVNRFGYVDLYKVDRTSYDEEFVKSLIEHALIMHDEKLEGVSSMENGGMFRSSLAELIANVIGTQVRWEPNIFRDKGEEFIKETITRTFEKMEDLNCTAFRTSGNK